MVNFSVLPPEINSGRMFFGAGSGPMLAAAAAWDGLAAELGLAAESFGLVTSGLAGGFRWPRKTRTSQAGPPGTPWTGRCMWR